MMPVMNHQILLIFLNWKVCINRILYTFFTRFFNYTIKWYQCLVTRINPLNFSNSLPFTKTTSPSK